MSPVAFLHTSDPSAGMAGPAGVGEGLDQASLSS